MNPQDSQSELDEIIETVATGVRHNQYMLDMQNRVPAAFNQLEFQVKREAKEAIEAYVTTRVKEAERLARVEELINLPNGHIESKYDGSIGVVLEKDLIKRYSELQASTTTTNGKEE